MLLQPTAIGTLVDVMERTFRSYGVDAGPLFERVGIDPEAASVPGARVEVQRIMRLWGLAVEATADPCFGLRAASFIRPTHFHALGLSWIAARTLQGGLERLVRYHDVVTMACGLELHQEGEECQLVLVHLPAIEMTPEAVDAFFTSVIRLSRMLVGDAFAPRRVELLRAMPDQPQTYEEVFAAPVRFSQSNDKLVFERRSLTISVSGGDETLATETAQIAERYLAKLRSSPTVEQVRVALFEMLPSGQTSLEQIAHWLHTSVSTLRRKLKQEGVTYRQVLDDTRRALAEGYVADRRYTFSEVAYLLGFAEQASFSKAFKRWTGSSPRRFRLASSTWRPTQTSRSPSLN
jgi:AraC-like DNA-binding protein